MDEVAELLSLQSGVISRRQAHAAGLMPHDIRRLIRRREWAPVHAGVYVDHTGPLTWLQRAWAAVLSTGPAALSHESALRAADGPGRRDRIDDEPIHVAVDRRRRSLVVPEGVVPHHLTDLGAKVHWNLGPPRVRTEHAVLAVATAKVDEFDVIATLADAVQSRRTTAHRLAEALSGYRRLPQRELVGEVLDDITDGTCSVLEHGYLARVELAHGLPRARRQVVASRHGPIYRDVVYEHFGVVVELDGRLFHDTARARNLDLGRDLAAAVDRLSTVRLGWGQVFQTPCLTAEHLAVLLRRRGWNGSPTPCRDCPASAA